MALMVVQAVALIDRLDQRFYESLGQSASYLWLHRGSVASFLSKPSQCADYKRFNARFDGRMKDRREFWAVINGKII